MGNIRTISFNRIRGLYKFFLEGQQPPLSPNTISTTLGDTFYLWKNASPDIFWNVVLSDSFEEDAPVALRKTLSEKSTGNVDSLTRGYTITLRKFKNFVDSHEIESDETDDETALKNFLLDIECLEPLSEWTSKFNLFDVLKITRTEIRHSNMLSWLINPNENHRLGDAVLRGFVQYVVSECSEKDDVFEYLLMDFHDCTVQREWRNIDVLVVSEEARFVLCIENKIDSAEHDNQLNRYRTIIEETYPNYKQKYIFLSPEGVESSDPDYWNPMSYEDVLRIIENVRKRVQLLPDVALLIDNYVDSIRRDIVGDEKLAKICAEIYAKHQRALDLIYENRPDKASEVASVITDWTKEKTKEGCIELIEDKITKSSIKFKTEYMSSLLPEIEGFDSDWNAPYHYIYEIRNNDGKEFGIQLLINSKNLPEEQMQVCEEINVHFPARTQKDNWRFRTPFSTKHRCKNADELSDEQIFEQLNKMLDEIKGFEAKLKNCLQGM